MRQLRANFCGFSFVAAIVALAQHLGFDLWGCASCSFVNELPISGILAWLGPVALLALTYGTYKDEKWANYALGVAACGSLSLFTWMILHNTICILCILVHTGVLAATLCLIPKVKFLGPAFFALVVAFTATSGWDRFSGSNGTAIFRPRYRETIPEGKVYVLFSDPECSRCQMVEAQIAKMPNPPSILYRWTLLPQNTYRSIRAIAALEMARMTSPMLFENLRKEFLATPPPLTDAVLIEAAKKVNLDIRGWLEGPGDQVLIAIEGDQTTSLELKIDSLPALAELSAPDVTGTRTLRRLPFSTIGLKP